VTARTLAAAVLVAFLGTAVAQQKADPKAAAQPAKAAEKVDIPKLLATRVTVDKFDGKFKDAVKMLADKYNLPIVIDPALGGGELAAMCDAPADDKQVQLPKLVDVRLDTVLNVLAAQVNGKFLVYPDHIRIVPTPFWLYETGVLQHDPLAVALGDDTPFLAALELQKTKPLIKRAVVSAAFKNKPLSDVLDEIAESTGANVALAPIVPANVRQAPVTVRFANTPVDAAVRTLCEMTETGVIEDANVLLVTTRERAAVRAKEDTQKLKDRRPPQQQIIGVGLSGALGGALPDVNGELLKLKEQNEQLKKELEEIKKLLKK
jgi:hypothetical protein